MANVQKENGFTPIANELLEAFYQCKLLEYERVCVMHIWRKTYGWNKKADWIANSQFSIETGIPRPHIARTLKTLFDKKIIDRGVKTISVNKNYDEWVVEWRVTSPGNRVTSPGNESLPHQVPTKESKDIIQKTIGETIVSQKLFIKRKKDMSGWNKTGDDFLEDDLQIDPDYKPKEKVARHYKDVYEIFKRAGMYSVDWLKNRTEQKAGDDLYTEKGLDQVEKALRLYKDHKDEEFCPAIYSPSSLIRKWPQLLAFKKKNGYG